MKVKFVKEASAPNEKLNVPQLKKILQDFTKAPVAPVPATPRTDVQKLNDREKLIQFCKGIQKGSPIDSYVECEPWAMPGYNDEVIMAAGAFIQGSSIELSADAPIREPYIAYLQGGLTFDHAKIGILISLNSIL